MKRIAFLILAHSDETNLRRLAQRLKPHPIFVHWDLKSGEPPVIDGVIFIRKRTAVYWAGFSMVEATIELIRSASRQSPESEIYALISGSCYPIKNTQLISDYISSLEKSSINCFRVTESPHLRTLLAKRVWRDGIFPRQVSKYPAIRLAEKVARKIINALLNLFPKKLPEDITLYHGSQWWVLHREAADYAVKTFDTRPEIVNFFRFTFAPDESFFHSVIQSSNLSKKCFPPMENVERGVFKTANIHLIDKSLSRTFTEKDIAEILSSEKLFVRKVDTKSSAKLLDEIDRAADKN